MCLSQPALAAHSTATATGGTCATMILPLGLMHWNLIWPCGMPLRGGGLRKSLTCTRAASRWRKWTLLHGMNADSRIYSIWNAKECAAYDTDNRHYLRSWRCALCSMRHFIAGRNTSMTIPAADQFAEIARRLREI